MSRTKNWPELKVGDTIKCRDADDAIRTSEELLKAGSTLIFFTTRTENGACGWKW